MSGPRSGIPIAPNVPAFPANSSSVAGSKHELSDGTPGGQASARRVIRSCSEFCPSARMVPNAPASVVPATARPRARARMSGRR